MYFSLIFKIKFKICRDVEARRIFGIFVFRDTFPRHWTYWNIAGWSINLCKIH